MTLSGKENSMDPIDTIEKVKNQKEHPVAFEFGIASDIGRVREIDEDSLVLVDLSTIFKSQVKRRALLIIADGMGGYNKGEIASKMCATTVTEKISPYLVHDYVDEEIYYHVLREALYSANQNILNFSLGHRESEGMGTTICAAVIHDDQLYLLNVGDSRAYVISKLDGINQVTKDHSYVQELVDKGQISEKEARMHPKRNVITKTVGYYGNIVPDISVVTIDDKDTILLCCDGLTNHVSDEEIETIVMDKDPQNACNDLIELANKRGGSDNISVIIAHFNTSENTKNNLSQDTVLR